MVLSAEREANTNLLADGLVYKLAEMKTKLQSSEVEKESLDEEVSVLLMADLQEKQSQENNALMQAMKQTVRFS